NATTGNETNAKAVNEFAFDAKFGKTGSSAGALLAMNKVASMANAFIESSTTTPDTTVTGSSVSVKAEDVAQLTSTSKVVGSTETQSTIDGIKTYLEQFAPSFDYTSKSGSRTVTPQSTIVYVPVGYVSTGTTNTGQTDARYLYKGSSTGPLDLGAQNYGDTN